MWLICKEMILALSEKKVHFYWKTELNRLLKGEYTGKPRFTFCLELVLGQYFQIESKIMTLVFFSYPSYEFITQDYLEVLVQCEHKQLEEMEGEASR